MTLIRIGYSGTRDGMTRPQMLAVYHHLAHVLLVNDNDPDIDGIEFHHGDCLGGDQEAHVIATMLGCRIVAHPPLNSRYRAYCKADEIREPKAYLPRDRDIAEETCELLAAPKSDVPYRGSGTWATVGYAVQLGARRPCSRRTGRTGMVLRSSAPRCRGGRHEREHGRRPD